MMNNGMKGLFASYTKVAGPVTGTSSLNNRN